MRAKRQHESTEDLAQRQQKDAEYSKKCQVQKKRHFIARQSLVHFNENMVDCQYTGKIAYICSECKSLMFKGEKSNKSQPTAESGANLPYVAQMVLSSFLQSKSHHNYSNTINRKFKEKS